MQAEHAIVIGGCAFLVVGGLLLSLSVRRGSELCRSFAERYPAQYAELGQPRPGYFDSPRRTVYFQFIMKSEFLQLRDPHLIEEFARLRRTEVRQLVFLIAGFAGLGAAFLWLEFAPGG
jgi:hypothetical protein